MPGDGFGLGCQQPVAGDSIDPRSSHRSGRTRVVARHAAQRRSCADGIGQRDEDGRPPVRVVDGEVVDERMAGLANDHSATDDDVAVQHDSAVGVTARDEEREPLAMGLIRRRRRSPPRR